MSEQYQSKIQNSTQEQENLQIGDYIMGKTIGEGTFGKVKLGTHKVSGENVAIKILEKQRINENSDVQRVTREINILKKLRHPYIIQLYEIIESKKSIFLIMECAQGGELFDYIVKSKKINEQESCKYIQQIVSGIEYLSKLQVAHRDLKPENLLFDSLQNIKIVDFGLSNTYKTDELLKTACGSPCYAAPEMIDGKKYNGLMSDIWSLGIIMYASICGYLPFEDKQTDQLYKKILKGDFKIPSFVSPSACSLLKGILNVDPSKRFTIQDIKNSDWYQIYNKTHLRIGIVTTNEKVKVCENILRKAESMGYDYETVKKNVVNSKHNKFSTLYYLLQNKMIREKELDENHEGCYQYEWEAIQQQSEQKDFENEQRRQKEQEQSQQKEKESIEKIKNYLKSHLNPSLKVDLIQENQRGNFQEDLKNSNQSSSLSSNYQNQNQTSFSQIPEETEEDFKKNIEFLNKQGAGTGVQKPGKLDFKFTDLNSGTQNPISGRTVLDSSIQESIFSKKTDQRKDGAPKSSFQTQDQYNSEVQFFESNQANILQTEQRENSEEQGEKNLQQTSQESNLLDQAVYESSDKEQNFGGEIQKEMDFLDFNQIGNENIQFDKSSQDPKQFMTFQSRSDFENGELFNNFINNNNLLENQYAENNTKNNFNQSPAALLKKKINALEIQSPKSSYEMGQGFQQFQQQEVRSPNFSYQPQIEQALIQEKNKNLAFNQQNNQNTKERLSPQQNILDLNSNQFQQQYSSLEQNNNFNNIQQNNLIQKSLVVVQPQNNFLNQGSQQKQQTSIQLDQQKSLKKRESGSESPSLEAQNILRGFQENSEIRKFLEKEFKEVQSLMNSNSQGGAPQDPYLISPQSQQQQKKSEEKLPLIAAGSGGSLGGQKKQVVRPFIVEDTQQTINKLKEEIQNSLNSNKNSVKSPTIKSPRGLLLNQVNSVSFQQNQSNATNIGNFFTDRIKNNSQISSGNASALLQIQQHQIIQPAPNQNNFGFAQNQQIKTEPSQNSNSFNLNSAQNSKVNDLFKRADDLLKKSLNNGQKKQSLRGGVENGKIEKESIITSTSFNNKKIFEENLETIQNFKQNENYTTKINNITEINKIQSSGSNSNSNSGNNSAYNNIFTNNVPNNINNITNNTSSLYNNTSVSSQNQQINAQNSNSSNSNAALNQKKQFQQQNQNQNKKKTNISNNSILSNKSNSNTNNSIILPSQNKIKQNQAQAKSMQFDSDRSHLKNTQFSDKNHTSITQNKINQELKNQKLKQFVTHKNNSAVTQTSQSPQTRFNPESRQPQSKFEQFKSYQAENKNKNFNTTNPNNISSNHNNSTSLNQPSSLNNKSSNTQNITNPIQPKRRQLSETYQKFNFTNQIDSQTIQEQSRIKDLEYLPKKQSIAPEQKPILQVDTDRSYNKNSNRIQTESVKQKNFNQLSSMTPQNNYPHNYFNYQHTDVLQNNSVKFEQSHYQNINKIIQQSTAHPVKTEEDTFQISHQKSKSIGNQLFDRTLALDRLQSQTIGLKSHRGPFNLRCVSPKHPKYLISEIIRVIEDMKLIYKNNSKFEIKCQKDEMSFDINVLMLHNADNLYLIKFIRYTGDSLKFNHITNLILSSLGM